MNETKFQKEISKYFSTSSKAFELVRKYKDILQVENLKHNLTRLSDDEKVYKDYFYESLIPFKNFDFSNIFSVLDIGTGSGIPGVLLKIFFPKIKLTLIEANSKKVFFLNKLLSELGIEATIINKRAENITIDEIEKFDLVTSRAVAPIDKIVEISSQYIRLNGYLILPKSINYTNEYKSLSPFKKVLGLELLKIDSFVSINKKQHNVLWFKKINHTNKEYPRSWNKIIKNPL